MKYEDLSPYVHSSLVGVENAYNVGWISASTSTIEASTGREAGCGNNPTVINSEHDTQYLASGPGDHFDFVRMPAHSDTVANNG